MIERPRGFGIVTVKAIESDIVESVELSLKSAPGMVEWARDGGFTDRDEALRRVRALRDFCFHRGQHYVRLERVLQRL